MFGASSELASVMEFGFKDTIQTSSLELCREDSQHYLRNSAYCAL